jgi:hypothetical protein
MSIGIFGCSFTHGWSVNDDETYPWLLQQQLPNCEVVNFGVGGYGTVHSLIQLRNALDEERKPDVAVIAYCSFHDERNTFLRTRRKVVAPYSRLGDILQPYARLERNGGLRIQMAEAIYSEFLGMRHSALSHCLETAYNSVEDRLCGSREVTRAIIREFSDLCIRNNIALVVAGMDGRAADMLDYCATSGIRVTSLAVDLMEPGNSNRPYDNHPSAKAHKIYAQKLCAFLKQNVLRHFEISRNMQPSEEGGSISPQAEKPK